MRDDYWTLSFPRLTQDASGDFYPDSPKDDTMTTDQPAWATDPLPPAVQGHSGIVWTFDVENGTYRQSWLSPRTPSALERDFGPVTPLWPDTPPTSPLPDLSRWHLVPVGATIPAGARFVIIWGDDDNFSSYVADPPGVTQRLGDDPRYAELLIPDPDAHWIRAIAEATPETAPTVYAAIKGEQA